MQKIIKTHVQTDGERDAPPRRRCGACLWSGKKRGNDMGGNGTVGKDTTTCQRTIDHLLFFSDTKISSRYPYLCPFLQRFPSFPRHGRTLTISSFSASSCQSGSSLPFRGRSLYIPYIMLNYGLTARMPDSALQLPCARCVLFHLIIILDGSHRFLPGPF